MGGGLIPWLAVIAVLLALLAVLGGFDDPVALAVLVVAVVAGVLFVARATVRRGG